MQTSLPLKYSVYSLNSILPELSEVLRFFHRYCEVMKILGKKIKYSLLILQGEAVVQLPWF